MAGVLRQIRRSSRKLVKDNVSLAKIDQKVLELQMAMEILAEVFGTNVSEIDDMLKRRYEADAEGLSIYSCKRLSLLTHRCDEVGDWPLEFCLVE